MASSKPAMNSGVTTGAPEGVERVFVGIPERTLDPTDIRLQALHIASTQVRFGLSEDDDLANETLAAAAKYAAFIRYGEGA